MQRADDDNDRVVVRKTLEPMLRSVDLEGRIIDCNDKYARMLGYMRDEIVGMSIFEHTPKESHNTLRTMFEQWKRHESINNHRFPLLTRHGKVFDVLITVGDVTDSKGKLVRSRTILLDYSEVSQMQELVKVSKYESLYEYSPEMYRTVNVGGVIIDSNTAYVEKMGYTKQEIIGRNLTAHTADRSISDVLISMAKWRTNGLCRSSEVWLKTKSGEEFPALITPTNLYADDGSLLGQNMVIQDLTKIEETKHLLQERQEIDKMKDEFLTGITHELKTPLTPIIGFSQALAKPGMLGDLNKRQESAVRTIMNNAIQLRQLVMDLLDIHKLELGRMKFNMAEFDIESMVDGVISSVEYAAQEKKIKIIKALDMTGPLIGDQFRVAEILANLVYNAVDFSPENTGKIEILSALEGNMARFTVRDNGVGIPLDKQQDLFKKFYQVSTTVVRRHGGTGLGLSICRGLAEGMGGKIGVKSAPGKGSTFFFTIKPGGAQQ